MGTDVAAFARQLKEDGIEAARQEAEKILSEANSKALSIIEEAKKQVEKREKEQEAEIAVRRQRMEAELRLVARDLIIEVRQRVEQIAVLLLKTEVSKALSDKKIVESAISKLVDAYAGKTDWRIALGTETRKRLAEHAVNDLFKRKSANVTLVEGLKQAGFELSQGKSSEVIELSEDSVSEAFRQLMSVELSRIITEKTEKAG